MPEQLTRDDIRLLKQRVAGRPLWEIMAENKELREREQERVREQERTTFAERRAREDQERDEAERLYQAFRGSLASLDGEVVEFEQDPVEDEAYASAASLFGMVNPPSLRGRS